MKSKRHSILIAEDDRALARVVRMHLERAGFTVYVAFDDEQSAILAARQRYDLIMTDVDSTGLNGVAFCRYVREELGLTEVPIAVFSSRAATAEMANLVFKYGITKLLSKPIDPELVVEIAMEAARSELAAL